MNKSEVEAIIRSLLTSSKSPIKILELKKTFKDVTGSDVPLFEHPSLEDFLLSIPETVTLTGTQPNLFVNLVKNAKSYHIARLVEKQRSRAPLENHKHFSEIKQRSVRNNSSFQTVYHTDDYKLHQYLLRCPDGCNFEDIKNILLKFENWNLPLRHYNILSFVKSYPFCIYFKGKFYAFEVFKKKILSNDAILND